MKQYLLIFLFLFAASILNAQDVGFKDVAPIFRSKCSTCHRPEQSGPFSLITYEDITKRASFIKDVIQRGYMPPWKADNHYVSFANDRSLTENEKSLIIRW